MNIIEYGHYDIASNELEIKEIISKALKFYPQTISTLPYYTKIVKSLIPKETKLSCILDYPFGLSDSESRDKSLEIAIKNGSEIVEVVAPSHLLCNRKYDKFRKELSLYSKLCSEANVELRYMLEYKLFTPELLYKAAHILIDFNIPVMYPSVNYLLDNVSDNILVSMLINQKNPKTKIIVNGSAWTDDHINMLFNNPKIYGYKTSNIYTLEKMFLKKQKNS
jgi:hypothetical protein